MQECVYVCVQTVASAFSIYRTDPCVPQSKQTVLDSSTERKENPLCGFSSPLFVQCTRNSSYPGSASATVCYELPFSQKGEPGKSGARTSIRLPLPCLLCFVKTHQPNPAFSLLVRYSTRVYRVLRRLKTLYYILVDQGRDRNLAATAALWTSNCTSIWNK